MGPTNEQPIYKKDLLEAHSVKGGALRPLARGRRRRERGRELPCVYHWPLSPLGADVRDRTMTTTTRAGPRFTRERPESTRHHTPQTALARVVNRSRRTMQNTNASPGRGQSTRLCEALATMLLLDF